MLATVGAEASCSCTLTRCSGAVELGRADVHEEMSPTEPSGSRNLVWVADEDVTSVGIVV